MLVGQSGAGKHAHLMASFKRNCSIWSSMISVYKIFNTYFKIKHCPNSGIYSHDCQQWPQESKNKSL